MIGTMQDITGRKQAEEELRRSQAFLEAAQAQAKVGSWQFDPGTMTGDWSKEMYRLFDRDPALGPATFAEFLELLHPEDRHLLEYATSGNVRPRQIEYRSNPDRGPMKYYLSTVDEVRPTEAL